MSGTINSQPETSTFSATVYELQENDLVLAGRGNVANAPLLDLANRTRWLKDNALALVQDGNTVVGTIALGDNLSLVDGTLSGTGPVPLSYSWPNGTLTSGAQVLFDQLMVFTVAFPEGLDGSLAQCDPGLTVAQGLTILSVPAGDSIASGTSIGGVDYVSGSSIGTVTSPSAVTLAPGERVALVGPSPADASFSNPKITILGARF
jgi:hypothetical protein